MLDFFRPDGGNYGLARRYLYGPAVDQVLAQENLAEGINDPERVYWMLTDNQGTVRDLMDHEGNLVEHYEYDAFGRVLAGNTSLTRYLYTAREFDQDTKLQYNRNRWYDTYTGRWLSEDPIGFAGDPSNLYRYVGNGPANATDPLGLYSATLVTKSLKHWLGNIVPTNRGSTFGAIYKFRWGNEAADVLWQEVSNSGTFSLIAKTKEGGTKEYKVSWSEKYDEAWIGRAGRGDKIVDRHMSGPRQAAELLESHIGARITRNGPNQLVLKFKGKDGGECPVISWSFESTATFTLGDGAYSSPVGFGVRAKFLGSGNHSIESDPTGLKRYLFPGGGRLPDSKPPYMNATVTSTDTWTVTWRDGDPKSKGVYTGGYQ